MGDSSTRFLRYLSHTNSQVANIYEDVMFLKPAQCLSYQCISVKDLKTHMKTVTFGEKQAYEPPQKQEGQKVSLRKFVPPQYTGTEVSRLKEALQDPNILFVAFPVLLIGKIPKCSTKDKYMHMTILLYNKITGAVELVDDMFGEVQMYYNYDKYIKTIVQTSILPYLRTFVGKKVSLKPVLPIFSESKYKKYLDLLLKHNITGNFTNAYKLFLVNYISARLTNPRATYKQVLRNVETYNEERLIRQYIELENFTKEYLATNTCENGTQMDMETRECISKTTSPQECGNNSYLELSSSSRKCTPLINRVQVQEHFASATPKRDVGSKTLEGISYVVSKHSNAAMIVPDDPTRDGEYMFIWEHDKDIDEWELHVPLNFDETWDTSISDPNLRFLVFLVFLKPKEGSDGHVNCLIYDKERDELERFEPNGTSLDEDINNGELLDDAIIEIDRFADLTYYPPGSYCPRGFHSRDGREAPNVISFGGNCVIWSLWYIDVRLSNPDLPRDVLTEFTYDYIKSRGSFKHFINGYRAYLQKQITTNTYSTISASRTQS